MSRLATLLRNPENYKTICNVTERNRYTCEGCIVIGFCNLRSNKMISIIPYRNEIIQTVGLLSHE